MTPQEAAAVLRMMTGAPYRAIARVLGVSVEKARYWADQRRRKQVAASNSKWRGKRPPPTAEQRKRWNLRRMAREEARERGLHPKDIYEQWGCT